MYLAVVAACTQASHIVHGSTTCASISCVVELRVLCGLTDPPRSVVGCCGCCSHLPSGTHQVGFRKRGAAVRRVLPACQWVGCCTLLALTGLLQCAHDNNAQFSSLAAWLAACLAGFHCSHGFFMQQPSCGFLQAKLLTELRFSLSARAFLFCNPAVWHVP